MEVAESRDYLRGVEPHCAAGQPLVHPHEGEQLSATLIGKQEVNIVRIFPRVNQGYDERVTDFLKHLNKN